jgi:hypothetical protein
MPLALIHIGSALFHSVSAWMSISFVLKKRIGRVWVLVFAAFLLKGALSVYAARFASWGPRPVLPWLPGPVAELFLSGLFASGFFLTGRWFGRKERLDGRCALLSEADRASRAPSRRTGSWGRCAKSSRGPEGTPSPGRGSRSRTGRSG